MVTLKDCRFVPSTVWNVQVWDSYIRDCTNRSSRAISSLAFKTCLQPPIIPSTRSGGTRSPDWSPAVDAVVHSRPKRFRSKLDRVYEDRLSDAIPDELWTAKSAELREQLRRVRTEMERHEVASDAYEAAGLQILELAQTAYSSYVAKNPREQARLVKTLVSNSTFDRGSLSPAYIKPFDVLANGAKTGDWLLRLDSNQQASG